MPPSSLTHLVLACACLTPTRAAQASITPAHSARHIEAPAAAPDDVDGAAFAKLSTKARRGVLAEIRAHASKELRGPFHELFTRLAALAAAPRNPRKLDLPKRTKRKKALRSDPDLHDALPFSVEEAYAWGDGSTGKRKLPRAAASTKARELASFGSWARGYPSGSDAMLATLLHAFDDERAIDRYAAFLERWRHQGRSFYRALDTTAGSPASVFIYDAMLADFVQNFVRPLAKTKAEKARARALQKSLEDTQLAMHEAFLKYRQHRGLREAMACAVLLAPSDAFPPVLARYENGPDGGYSIRQQMQILLAHFDFDVDRFGAWMARATGPMPRPLWDREQRYAPGDAFQAAFRAEIPRMLEEHAHTDRLLEEFCRHREEYAAQVRAIVRGVGAAHDLLAAPPDK